MSRRKYDLATISTRPAPVRPRLQPARVGAGLGGKGEGSAAVNHRYVLRRHWLGDGGIVNFIMLNPSTADDVFDDATIRRCVGFAKRWGFSGLTVTNLCAYRATQPTDLYRLIVQTPNGRSLAIGDGNTVHIEREAQTSKMVVCAWGDNCDLVPHRDLDVIQLLRRDHDLYCIRRTAKGNPAHPVREKYTNMPELFYSQLGDG